MGRKEVLLMPATLANGKICYIEIPADDTRRAADSTGRSLAGGSDGAATAIPRSTTRRVK
jgi:hypothetical protein